MSELDPPDETPESGPKGPESKTKKRRRERIRPVSRITSGAFSKLRNARCFTEIDRRVRLGWTANDLAKAVHEEFDELKDVGFRYLARIIDRYRKSIPPAELSLISPASELGRAVTAQLSEGIDEIAELNRLYRIQDKRIQIDIANEIRINKLLPSTANEFIVATKIIKQISDLKMDLGLVKRQLGSVEVTGRLAAEATTRYGKESVGKVIADPDSRRKLLNLAERLAELKSKDAVEAAMFALSVSDEPADDAIDVEVVEVPTVDDPADKGVSMPVKETGGQFRSDRTGDEELELIKRQLADLSPDEREAFLIMMREMNDPAFRDLKDTMNGGPARIFDVINEAEYIRPVVDMKTFVTDPYFMGETCSSLYQTWQDDLEEAFSGAYHHVVMCLHPDTPIPLLNGQTETIAKLAERWAVAQDKFWVYGVEANGKVVPALAEQPRQTGVDDYYKITLDDGTHFVTNARHQMVMRDGAKRMVSEMKPGDSIMPFVSNNHLVVSIEQFGNGPVYCMTVPETTNFAICTRTETGEINHTNSVFSSNTGGIGIGKTMVGSVIMLRLLYELSCLRNVHDSVGLARGSRVDIVAVSVTQKLAQEVIFENIKTKLIQSPYFAENFVYEETKSELRFPGQVHLAARASNDTAALGLNVHSYVMDEASFMEGETRGKASMAKYGDKDKAQTLYDRMVRRIKSRFSRKGRYEGMVVLLSSKRKRDDFTVRMIEESKDDPGYFVRDYNTYQLNPERFSSETFKVLVGNETIDSRILTVDEAKIWADKIAGNVEANAGLQVIEVPIDFKSQFIDDIDKAIQDVAGVSTVTISPFISQREKIVQCVSTARKHPFSVVSWDQSAGGHFLWNQIAQQVKVRDAGHEFTEWQPKYYPKFARHIHIDPSINGDCTGFAVGAVVGTKQIQRINEDDGSFYTETAPMIWVDFMIEIVPPAGGEIDFAKVRWLVYELQKHGFYISFGTSDQFQSVDTRQKLMRKGIEMEHMSVDRPIDAYECLRTAIYEGRLLMYDYEPVLKQLRELQLDRVKSKVDHPVRGKKDVADALCGIAFSLSNSPHHAPLMMMSGLSQYADPEIAEVREQVEVGEEEFVMPFLSGGEDFY